MGLSERGEPLGAFAHARLETTFCLFRGLGFRGLGFRVWRLGFRVWGLGLCVSVFVCTYNVIT